MQSIAQCCQTAFHACATPFRKTYTATVCGHRTKKVGLVQALPHARVVEVPPTASGVPEYCLACLASMTIKCAWCGGPIHVGDPVTLHAPRKAARVPKHAVAYHEDPQRFVGCLSWNCKSLGVDRQGFWMSPGCVLRVPSPLELLASGGGAARAVTVGDLRNPHDLGRLIR
jgi:hypothetical protein